MKKIFFVLLSLFFVFNALAQKESNLKNKDRKRDVLMITSMGDMLIRLSDSTPLHRDNFLILVKKHFYDSVLFHRVIQNFMIQGGDPKSKTAEPGIPLGNGGLNYTIPAEFRQTMFHKKGVIAAARMGDESNPEKSSSSCQFYIAQGKIFTDAGLDSVELMRMSGRKIPTAWREVYKTIGGIPHLDQNYTVYGEVISGLDIVDKIASVQTSKGRDVNRPLQDVRITEMKLVKRKKKPAK